MDLTELKDAWNKYSSQEADRYRVEMEGMHGLLQKKTQTLVDRIDRNIRIGMIVLGLYIAYNILDYLFLTDYFSKMVTEATVEYPQWLELVDVFSMVIIVATYLFFVIRYVRIRKNFSAKLQLKSLLEGIREILVTYRRMFFFAVVVFLTNILISFIAGVFQGIVLGGNGEGISINAILRLIGLSVLILIPLIAGLFLILRWGFNRLYGQYLAKISDMLRELDESGSAE